MISPTGDTYGAFPSDSEAVKHLYVDTDECLESPVTGPYSEYSTYSGLIAIIILGISLIPTFCSLTPSLFHHTLTSNPSHRLTITHLTDW